MTRTLTIEGDAPLPYSLVTVWNPDREEWESGDEIEIQVRGARITNGFIRVPFRNLPKYAQESIARDEAEAIEAAKQTRGGEA